MPSPIKESINDMTVCVFDKQLHCNTEAKLLQTPWRCGKHRIKFATGFAELNFSPFTARTLGEMFDQISDLKTTHREAKLNRHTSSA